MSRFFPFFQKFFRNTRKKIFGIKIIGRKFYSLIKYINYTNAFQFAKYSTVALCGPQMFQVECNDVLENNIKFIIETGENALEDGRIQEAETLFLIAAKLAETNNIETAIIHCYDKLVTISYIMGDFINAKDLIDKIIERLKGKGIAADDDIIIEYRLKLARLHGYLSHTDLADKIFKECISIQKRKRDESATILLIDLYFWYGIFLFQNQRYAEAAQNIEMAYQHTNKTSDAHVEPAQKLILLAVLAEVYSILENFDRAINCLENAISIGKNINHPELAFCYIMLGNIYIQKGLYNEARRWCQEGERLGKEQDNSEAQQASEACFKRIREQIVENLQKNQKQA